MNRAALLCATVWLTGCSTKAAPKTAGGNVRFTLGIAGAGRGWVSSPAGFYDCPSTCTYPQTRGKALELTAVPDTGSSFTGWIGACSGTGACKLPFDADTMLGAEFEPARVAIEAEPQGQGTGTITITDGNAKNRCSSNCGFSYTYGTTVVIRAEPDATSRFVGWEGACSGTSDCAVLLKETTHVRAHFGEVRLTVAPRGAGRITSQPAGIDCGASCSARFTRGSTVTLTAIPDQGAKFGGWGAPCGAGAVCKVFMDGLRSVGAQFEGAQP